MKLLIPNRNLIVAELASLEKDGIYKPSRVDHSKEVEVHWRFDIRIYIL